jgi:tetratricopeptide (TPR) repeat protein
MDSDARCLCDHKNNAHSDSGCQWPDCRCKEWRENKPVNLDANVKTSVNTSTRKLAERFEKMTSHKKRLKKDSDELKMQKISRSSKSSKSEKFDFEEKLRDELYKLNKKEEWKKIDEQLEMRLKSDHENVNIWIEKGQNFLNWNNDDEAIHCFKNALMFENKQDNTFDKKDYQILISLSKIYHRKKDYPEAIKYCDESVKIKPENIKAFKQLGKIYRDLPDYELSKQNFHKVLERESEETNVLNNLGYVHIVNEEWDEAIKFLRKSRQINERENVENDIYAQVHEVQCYYKKKDLETAELLINKEKVVKNNNDDSYKLRGFICKDLGKFKEAIENFEKECSWGYKVRNGVWFDLAYCEQKIGNLAVAIEYYKKDIEIFGLGAITAQNLGYAYVELGQYENALKWYKSGLEKFPGTIPLLINKAGAYRKQLQYDDAIECYNEVLNKNPSLLCTSGNKAECLSSNGKHKEAIQLFEAIREALTQSETMPLDSEDRRLTEEDVYWQLIGVPPDRKECNLEEEDLLNYISWEWIEIGEYEKGLKIVNEALKINSKKWSIIDTKAVALKKIGRFKEAKEWYEKVFEITKEEGDELEIGICHRKGANRFDEDTREKHNLEAIKIFDSILEKNKSNSEAWYEKSLCYWNLKKYDDAIECLKESIKINPHKKKYWFELGENKRKADNPIQAILHYDKSIELDPTSEDYMGKGSALNDLKKYDDAIECYDDAISTYDENRLLFPFAYKTKVIANIWILKGNTLEDQNKSNDAIVCYEKSIELDPKDKIPWGNKGNCLRIIKEYDDAIKTLNDTLEIDPKYQWAYFIKILTYADWEKYSDAIKLAEDTLEQFKKEVKNYAEAIIKKLIEIYEKIGDTSKQKEWEKKLQEIRDLKNNKTDGV